MGPGRALDERKKNPKSDLSASHPQPLAIAAALGVASSPHLTVSTPSSSSSQPAPAAVGFFAPRSQVPNQSSVLGSHSVGNVSLAGTEGSEGRIISEQGASVFYIVYICHS